VRHGIAVYQRCWEILEQVAAVNRDLLRQRRARGGGEDGAGRGPAGARRRKSQ
jgi:hypothetical protein